MAALGQKQKHCILRGVASSAHCLRCHRAIGGCLYVFVYVYVCGREIERQGLPVGFNVKSN